MILPFTAAASRAQHYFAVSQRYVDITCNTQYAIVNE